MYVQRAVQSYNTKIMTLSFPVMTKTSMAPVTESLTHFLVSHNIKNNKPKGSQLSIPIKEALWLFKVTQDNNLPNEDIMVEDHETHISS